MPVVGLPSARNRIPRVQVERHVETFQLFPERPVWLSIEIDGRLHFMHLRKTIDQYAFEAECLDGSMQFLDSGIWILHG